ncbi:MAG TPA: mandelate racemase/muconate lactonizing enzyme family protein [Nocardioidaceae bacterium]|nr:mandelate racemase/muconate lactonizing enzyme family protein [Nocardioidaceae bacterium]
MRIETVDVFYLAMPEILDIGDGSQDVLLVRVRGGGHTGWGECEASPLTSIASLVCPMSHSACRPVIDSVLGQRVDSAADIARIATEVRASSLDLLQADHTLSGITNALWDLLGQATGRPVYELLGHDRFVAKTPYASALFGETPQQTLEKALDARDSGFVAAKFGWAGFGRGSVEADADQVHAAREGLGADGILLVDAGTVWNDDVEAAALRLPALEQAGVLWLEEPFVSGALTCYRSLARRCRTLRLAGGEGAHNALLARHLIDHGEVGFVQIDTGRIGGIGDAQQVADYARSRDVQFVNHTFTSHLALSASLQPFADRADDWLCEYPVEAKNVARRLTRNHIELDKNGQVVVPPGPGLGMQIDVEAVRDYLVDVEITVAGKTLYTTPDLTS